jgi:hypothetical protein
LGCFLLAFASLGGALFTLPETLFAPIIIPSWRMSNG